MDLLQSRTLNSYTITLDELLKDVKKQLEIWQDLGRPWKVKLSPIQSTGHSNEHKIFTNSSREFEKLLHKNEKKFEKIINVQDAQIEQVKSAAKITQDTMHTLYQTQRVEDELRHKNEVAMQEIEILILRKKLIAADKMLSLENDESIYKDKEPEKEESLASLSRKLQVARLMIEIRDAELIALRDHIDELKSTSSTDITVQLQQNMELLKEKFQELSDNTLYGTKLLQRAFPDVHEVEVNGKNCLEESRNFSKRNLWKRKPSRRADKSARPVHRLSSLAGDLLESLNDDATDIDHGTDDDYSLSGLTTPKPSSVVPISQSFTGVQSKSSLGKAAHPTKSYSTPSFRNYSSASFSPKNQVRNTNANINKLPPSAKLVPENLLNISVDTNSTTSDPANYNFPENTSSLELLSSVCPPPLPTPTTYRQQEEELFLLSKLPPIKIPKSKLNIPSNNNNNALNKRSTGWSSAEKASDAFANKRLRTFVSIKPAK